jgi:hypothetical protein
MPASEELTDSLHRALKVRLLSTKRACDGILDLLSEYTFNPDDVANAYAIVKQCDERLCEAWGNADAGCLTRADEHIAHLLVDSAEAPDA